jgi:hypothetical protein
MFAPTREQVRQFFFDTWKKYQTGTPLQGLESLALEVILMHPEYASILNSPERTVDKDYTPEMGQTNPFLHMSLHLALSEQVSIDQPEGIRVALRTLIERIGNEHAAQHAALDCLGEMLWRAQTNRTPPDAAWYLECVNRQ